MSGTVFSGHNKIRSAPEAVAALVDSIGRRRPATVPGGFVGAPVPLPPAFTGVPSPDWDVAITNNAMSAGPPLMGKVAPDVAEVCSALAAIPKVEWDKSEPWNAIARGLAFETHFHPSLKEALYAGFDEACKGVGKYDAENNRKLFDRFVKEVPGYEGRHCTIATIFFEAKKWGWAHAPGGPSTDMGTNSVDNSGPDPLTGAILALLRNAKTNKPISCLQNAKRIIVFMGVTARRDEFSGPTMISGNIVPQDYVGPVSDGFVAWLRDKIMDQHGYDPGKIHLYDAIEILAEAGRENPVTAYISGTDWDGTKRLNSWFVRVTGCNDTPFNRCLGLLLLLAMCVRAWPAAAAAGEERRSVEIGEIALQEILANYVKEPKSLKNPNGAWFMPTTDLQDRLRVATGINNTNAKAIAAWMRKIGWQRSFGNNQKGNWSRGYEKF